MIPCLLYFMSKISSSVYLSSLVLIPQHTFFISHQKTKHQYYTGALSFNRSLCHFCLSAKLYFLAVYMVPQASLTCVCVCMCVEGELFRLVATEASFFTTLSHPMCGADNERITSLLIGISIQETVNQTTY